MPAPMDAFKEVADEGATDNRQATSSPVIGRLALIGIGLIGSSLARAVKSRGLAREITCAARSERTCETVRRLGLVDRATLDAREAVDGADLIVLCTPLSTYPDLAAQLFPHCPPGTIISDVGSVKQVVLRDVAPYVPDGVHLVPAHPIAGTEHSGPEAGFADLFEGRWCILTPAPGTNAAAVETVAALWRGCGSMIEVMDALHHDRVLALTSHLPHLIAYTIVGTAVDLEDETKSEVIRFSASGFRDFTRIAASDPVMWRDIFLNNRDAVLEIIQRFNEDLTALQRAIRWGEGDTLERLFTRTREIRRSIIEAKQAR